MSFGSDDYPRAIARLWDSDGNVIGTGFLVAPGYVLTCAHVVLQAIGMNEDDFSKYDGQPQEIVSLDFPVLATEKKIEAEVVAWEAYRLGYGDVAVLKLRSPEPKGVKPIPLVMVEQSEVKDEKHRVYGFGKGDLGGQSDAYRPKTMVSGGRFQLCKFGDANDETIIAGFSGAPVWNEARNGVIGMIATAMVAQDGQQSKAHAISTQMLKSVLMKVDSAYPWITQSARRSWLQPEHNLSQTDWNNLFVQFKEDDLPDLKRAFQKGFETAQGFSFEAARTGRVINELIKIRDELVRYDVGPEGAILAVRFVEFAVKELERSQDTHTRDLTELKGWRDRIAQQFNVPNPAPKLNQTLKSHAYLMVALEEIGAQVIVYPELHITGKDRPIDFGATPTTCDFNDVAITLSEWIRMAEEAIAADELEDDQVTLELFLPCRYLEEEIEKTWRIQDKRGREIDFGQYRRFLVRSFDRIRDRQVQRSLKSIWLRLETCVNEQNACSQFHTQDACPEKLGTLRSILNDKQATGLKFVAAFPKDSKQRQDLLYDIIDAAIPIALWSSEQMDADSNTIEAEFDLLLSQSQVTNFASLARQWRMKRTNSSPSTPMRLLCDRPDRVPKLPDPSQEDDLLVAS